MKISSFENKVSLQTLLANPMQFHVRNHLIAYILQYHAVSVHGTSASQS